MVRRNNMYAVVYKNRVIVGPMDWNRAIFEGSLEKEKIIVNLPRVAPDTFPYVVDNDTKIMQVEEVRPPMNLLVEYYYGPLWEITETKAIANYQVCDSPVDAAKVNLRGQAAEERWKKEVAGITLTIQNTEVSLGTDRNSREVFVQKYAMMNDGATVNWKFPEAWLSLTKQQFTEIVTAIDSHVQSSFDWEKTINDQIDSASTKAELLAINIVEQTTE